MRKLLTFWGLVVTACTACADYYVDYRLTVPEVSNGDLVILEAASTTQNYGYYMKETSDGFFWKKGLDNSCVWQLISTGDANTYYFKNVSTGNYIAGKGDDVATCTVSANQSDAAQIKLNGWASNWNKYDAYEQGWDKNSIIITNVTYDNYNMGNRVYSNSKDNGIFYQDGLHCCPWNIYKVTESSTPYYKRISLPDLKDGIQIIAEAASTTRLYGYYLTDYSSHYGLNHRNALNQRLGLSPEAVWQLVSAEENTNKYYMLNATTNNYISKEDLGRMTTDITQAEVFTIQKNPDAGTATYSNTSSNPTGWDENSVAFQTGSNSNFYIGNDVSKMDGTDGMIYYDGAHRRYWNIYKLITPVSFNIRQLQDELKIALVVGVGFVNGIKDEASKTDAQAVVEGSPTLSEVQSALANYVINLTDGYYRIYNKHWTKTNDYLRFTGENNQLLADLNINEAKSDMSSIFDIRLISSATNPQGDGYIVTMTSQGDYRPVYNGDPKHMVNSTDLTARIVRPTEYFYEGVVFICPAQQNGTIAEKWVIYKKPEGEGRWIYGNGGAAASARFYLEPATDITVKMNLVGSDYWATLYVPFGVTLPEETEAYVGAIDTENNTIRLTSIGQDVPAATPVVLKGNAASITATINDVIPAYTGSNGLSGQYLAASSRDDNIRSLGVKDGVIGFYKLPTTSTGLGANKAFINMSSSAAGFRIMIDDDDVTALSNTEISNFNSQISNIFDLQGRKVASPKKGQIYIVNGKTVLY